MDAYTKDNTIISVIAHDLKDPLNAIMSISEILLGNWGELKDEEKIRFIEDIHGSCKITQTLLADLLIWSKGIANDFKPFASNFNLKELTNKNLELAYANAMSHGIKITNYVDTDIYVYADENMISTVFRNLIANSVKHIKAGSEIELYATVKNGFCLICISDNGTGINDPQVSELFKTFDANDLKIPDYKNEGLGLVLCKDFIFRNGGKIWFESDDSGTKFFFTIPLSNPTLQLD